MRLPLTSRDSGTPGVKGRKVPNVRTASVLGRRASSMTRAVAQVVIPSSIQPCSNSLVATTP